VFLIRVLQKGPKTSELKMEKELREEIKEIRLNFRERVS